MQRNISSQCYYRMLGTQKKELVESEMKELTAPYQNDKLEFIKNPVVAEFLGFSQNTDFTENDLEKSILSNLQKFLMEFGKGYAFVARQQHIHTEKQDYYIDLVFYNYILKCFVLIDLKTEKITHQDLQLQREEHKLMRKTISKEKREAEKQRRYDLKQQKRKEKYRGR